MRFTVIQHGARMHYAVPLIFERAGILERFYTDFAANKGWPRLLGLVPHACRSRTLCRLASRVPHGIPPTKIHAFPTVGVGYALARIRARNAVAEVKAHFSASDKLAARVLRRGLGEATHVYVFDTASLVLMRAVAGCTVKLVMEQTNAPRAVMGELLRQEHLKHPAWAREPWADAQDDLVMNRYTEAWHLADLIVCGSEFVRQGIRRCGGPVEKCEVVPYGVDSKDPELNDGTWRSQCIAARHARRKKGEPFHVLCVGDVGLRKGAPYFLAAALALGSQACFRMVGSLQISKEAEQRLAQHVELLGMVPRNEVREHYRWADAFLLPSVCEGSATVTYEALAYGLPVVCTPNTGSVVRDGVDGLLVTPSSAEAVIAALQRLISHPEQWLSMSRAAFVTSDQMDVRHYGERLLKVLSYKEVTGGQDVVPPR